MDADDKIITRDIERLNLGNFPSPRPIDGRWDGNGKVPMKSRAKSEYSYLDKVNSLIL